jgi:hypothetical protein
MEHLHEAGEISRKYQAQADILRYGDDVQRYYRYAQAAAFLKKFEGMDEADVARADVATLEKWYESEGVCKNTNERLWALKNAPISQGDTPLGRLVAAVKEEIFSLLGEDPPEYAEVSRFGKFGPGASLSHSRSELDSLLKTVNPTALLTQCDEVNWLMKNTMMAECVIASRYGLRGSTLEFLLKNHRMIAAVEGIEWVDYERYATVPKNVEVRRSIGVGPSLGTWIQQSYDGYIRNRLKTDWGIDLSDQGPNQALAYLGSTNSYDRPCTIDLTDASSRIAYGLVVMLFSGSWARCLISQRASFCLMPDGSKVRLEKFSAMGNALTFSLQSLIFSAIVRVVLRTHGLKKSKWRVYGDDIIVPYSIYDDVCAALVLLGMEPNKTKSYKDGFFRESCGVDYLHGTLVRPLYFKKPVSSVQDLYKVLNLVQATVVKAPIPAHSYRRLYKYLLSAVPEGYRIFGEPSTVLDGYIWTNMTGIPDIMLGRASPSFAPPERWARLRALLIGSECESHVREQRVSGGYRIAVTGKRSGIALPDCEYRWLRADFLTRLQAGKALERMFTFFA